MTRRKAAAHELRADHRRRRNPLRQTRRTSTCPRSSSCSPRAAWRWRGRAMSATTASASPPTLRDAFASGDVVFCCGGIGATPDDHTRQCAARGARPCRWRCTRARRELILERMRDVAAEHGVPFEPDRAGQRAPPEHGHVPGGAEIIPNPYNKIPGFSRRRRALRARLSGDGLADDRMGARHALSRTCTAATRCVEKLGHRLRRDGSHADAVDGRDRGSASPASRCSACPASTTRSTGRHIELGVKGAASCGDAAYADLRRRTAPTIDAKLGPELVR